jgi:hypothetical protein
MKLKTQIKRVLERADYQDYEGRKWKVSILSAGSNGILAEIMDAWNDKKYFLEEDYSTDSFIVQKG